MINLTPHPITIRTADGDIVLPPDGTVARVSTVETDAGAVVVDDSGRLVPVIRRQFGKVIGLPEEDLPCVVSSLVLEAVRVQQPWRRAIYAPDAGPTAIRDQDGRILAVTRLVGV